MSRAPDTPREDDGPAGDSELPDIPAGRRFSGDPELLEIEADLVPDGATLENRAIPIEYHAVNLQGAAAIREAIEQETAKDHPNKEAIGYLNTRLQNNE